MNKYLSIYSLSKSYELTCSQFVFYVIVDKLKKTRKYPKYYETAYGYNFHHLNYKGANLLSNEMAKQVVSLMKVERDSI